MALQQPISLRNNERWIGAEWEVLVEGRRGADLVARSWRDAPEIDGTVLVSDGGETAPGDWVRVRVTGAQPYDMIAAPAADTAGTA
jgi:ribosomal protein S12 methylthiotransferase